MIKCENCIYFKSVVPNSAQWAGNCIRYAPRAGDIQSGGFWPFVYFDQSCGEFISKINSNDYISNYEYEDECSE